MNHERIKTIAKATWDSLPQEKDVEKMIDKFVLAYTRAILFEATDVIREKAKEYSGETGIIMKSTAVDVLDHFGL